METTKYNRKSLDNNSHNPRKGPSQSQKTVYNFWKFNSKGVINKSTLGKGVRMEQTTSKEPFFQSSIFISPFLQHLSLLMNAHTATFHFFFCFSLLNPVTHQLSGVSYSLCSFCVQITSPIKILGFLVVWLQKNVLTKS